MQHTVRAPFAGYASLTVHAGDWIDAGDPVATVEAVKMEAAVRSPAAGRVRIALSGKESHVSGGEPLVWIEAE